MSIETDLMKDGITIIKPIDTLSATLIAKFVAEKFIAYFPFSHMKYDDLFVKVSNLNMYIADMPKGMSEANYFYKNETIYFKDGLNIDEMEDLIIHEFIHHYQEKKDKNNILYRLGLCDYTRLKVHGLALNEAAVQLISSKILRKKEESVKYYGIDFTSISPTYYPLLCNLIDQLSYIIGYDILVDSTLNSNDKFKNCIIKTCGKNTFNQIEKNFDKILKTEEQIIIDSSILQQYELTQNQISKISYKIESYKQSIQNTFIKTQNLILTSYFDSALKNVYSIQDIENFREKLYLYKDYLGTTENYSYFNNYYINMMSKLEEIREGLTDSTALTVYNRSTLEIILSKFSKLFGKSYETENVYNR